NLGATSRDIPLVPPPVPAPQPSTNTLFVEAQKGIPGPPPAAGASEFRQVLRPFVGSAYATGFGQSEPDLGPSIVAPLPDGSGITSAGPGIGPLAIAPLPDGSALVSGGAGRNQLFHVPRVGGAIGNPLATLPQPIYALAFDTNGAGRGSPDPALWAATGGGPLLRLDPNTGAILDQYGDSLTQALAVDPTFGKVYVASGSGIETFDPSTKTFSHYSDVRVGSLAFGPDGLLWAVTWPHHENQVIRFDNHARSQLMLT